jgi:hypothetical protein
MNLIYNLIINIVIDGGFVELIKSNLLNFHDICRNPTLAKCGGEAQHLEKVRIWSPPGLPNV